MTRLEECSAALRAALRDGTDPSPYLVTLARAAVKRTGLHRSTANTDLCEDLVQTAVAGMWAALQRPLDPERNIGGYLWRTAVREVSRASRAAVNSDVLFSELGTADVTERESDEEPDDNNFDATRLLECLSPRQREAVTLYFGLAGERLNYSECAARLGITKKAARDLVFRAIERMREAGNGQAVA